MDQSPIGYDGELAWDKIASTKPVADNVTLGFLRPESIEQRYPMVALSAHWGEHLLQAREDRACVTFDTETVPLYLVDLQIETYGEPGPIEIRISSENESSVYALDISAGLPGGYQYRHVSGPKISIAKSARQTQTFEEYMVIDPVVIHYVDGCFSYNKYLIRTGETADHYPIDRIETQSFPNIKLESMGKEQEAESIQPVLPGDARSIQCDLKR